MTWRVVAGAALTVLLAASGMIIADTRGGIQKAQTAVECLQKEKLDKEQYYRDMTDIRETLKAIDRKVDWIMRDRK